MRKVLVGSYDQGFQILVALAGLGPVAVSLLPAKKAPLPATQS